MIAGRIQITVYGNEIGIGEQRLEVCHFDAGFGDKDMVDFNNVRAVDFHAKGARPARHCFANVANADHAERTFTERPAGDLFPFARFHLPVHPGLAAGKRQDVTQDRVRDGEGERVLGAAKLDPITGTGFGVD